MKIIKDIETGKEYFWKKVGEWDWNNEKRWWEVFVEFAGLNGGGGAWLEEKWRWNNSSQNIRKQVRTLSWEDTHKVISEIKHNADMSRKESNNKNQPTAIPCRFDVFVGRF